VRNVSHSAIYLSSHLKLLFRVTRSEIASRFAGSLLGIGWWALNPLMLLAIYAVIYLLVLKVKAPQLSGAEYVILIFTGLVPFLMSSESLLNGVSSVVANKAVLSNTVFPIDLVPVKIVLLGQVTMACGTVVVLVASAVVGRLSPALFAFPILWMFHIMFLIGVVWVLSLVNLVFRDLQNIVGIVVMYLMIASPIAYTPEMVPKSMTLLLTLNPLAHYIVAYQDLVVFGRLPTLAQMFTITTMSVSTFLVGGFFFVRAKRTFIDYV
jgi:homopolymeric O-antigen transport system permease protein